MTIESTAIGDRHLISEVSARNIAAVGDLCHRYRDRADRVAWLVCRDDGRAQDIVQDAAVWRSATSYRPQRGTGMSQTGSRCSIRGRCVCHRLADDRDDVTAFQ